MCKLVNALQISSQGIFLNNTHTFSLISNSKYAPSQPRAEAAHRKSKEYIPLRAITQRISSLPSVAFILDYFSKI